MYQLDSKTCWYSGRIVAVFLYSFVVFGLYRAGDPVIRVNDFPLLQAIRSLPFFDSIARPSIYRNKLVGYPAAIMILLVGESFRIL